MHYNFRWKIVHMEDIQDHPSAIISGEAPQIFCRVLQVQTRDGPQDDGYWGEWKDVPIT